MAGKIWHKRLLSASKNLSFTSKIRPVTSVAVAVAVAFTAVMAAPPPVVVVVLVAVVVATFAR